MITELCRYGRGIAWSIQSILGLRPLQNWFVREFNPLLDRQDRILSPPQAVLRSLAWWTKEHNVCSGLPFNSPQPSVSLTTDASSQGWGAHLQDLTTHSHWSTIELSLHINALELLAVEKALKSFAPLVKNRVVQLITDNTTVKFYVNKQGGTHSQTLLSIVSRIWEWCIRRHVFLVVIHLPGVDNVFADSLSRTTLNNHEWHLHRREFKFITRRWGTPTIDLFASPANTQCPRFCARMRPHASPGCLGDAFLFSWVPDLLYAFPPLPLLARVVAKIVSDNSNCILIAPWWPRQPWFATLLEASRGDYIHLRNSPNLLTVHDGLIRHPDVTSFRLTAWRIRPQLTSPTPSVL
nr:PREDICTED: uncharacterized protein LOC107982642 [Anolis carolinensis]|eukprot:XP_016847900.1 PREDICTED: uncharacterized protein LOC107982642 [Anolis carolinensis]